MLSPSFNCFLIVSNGLRDCGFINQKRSGISKSALSEMALRKTLLFLSMRERYKWFASILLFAFLYTVLTLTPVVSKSYLDSP